MSKEYKDAYFRYKMNDEQIENMIGALALDIRYDWSDWHNVKYRVNIIKDLCQNLGRSDLLEQIDENIENIGYDGRWFRDHWNGPYGCDFTRQNVGDTLYDEYRDIMMSDSESDSESEKK